MKKRSIISLVVTVLLSIIIYYFQLPPINITSISFWSFAMLTLAIYLFLNTVSRIDKNGINFEFKKSKILIIVLLLIPMLIILTNFVLSPLFNAKSFSKRITIIEDTEEKNFISEVAEVDFNSLPLLDKDSSSR